MSTISFGFTAQQLVDEARTTWKDIATLKTWLATQNLPQLTDEQVAIFLLSCSNEQEPTRATIGAFYRIRNGCPEIFSDRTMSRVDIQQQLKTVEFCVMPQRMDDGCMVIQARFCDTNYLNFEVGPCIKVFYMMLDAALYENPPQGLVILLDMKGMGILHLTRLRLRLLKILFQYLQEGLPLRLKNVHVLNTAYFIDKLLFLIKPFVSKQVLDAIVFHSSNMDMEEFYEKWVPRKDLPEEYGGELPSLQALRQQTVNNLEALEGHFEAEELQRCSIVKS